MPIRTVRAVVHSGKIEPLERVDLPDGSEVTLTFETPSPARAANIVLGEFDVGVKTPFNRDEVYDEST